LGGAHLDVLEHVGVVADLLQLHDGVHQGLGAAFALKEHNDSASINLTTLLFLKKMPL